VSDNKEFPVVRYVAHRNEFDSLLVTEISHKRAHSVTASPVSGALSSLQWFVGCIIGNIGSVFFVRKRSTFVLTYL